MEKRWERAGLSLAVTGAAAVLVVLATLEYRWIGQVSQAERERMRTHLQAATTRLGQDFDGELARLFMTCQGGAPGGPGGVSESLGFNAAASNSVQCRWISGARRWSGRVRR